MGHSISLDSPLPGWITVLLFFCNVFCVPDSLVLNSAVLPMDLKETEQFCVWVSVCVGQPWVSFLRHYLPSPFFLWLVWNSPSSLGWPPVCPQGPPISDWVGIICTYHRASFLFIYLINLCEFWGSDSGPCTYKESTSLASFLPSPGNSFRSSS